ncbi:MAG: hypothetical protein KC434_07405, partial [Anaerolineales bacterium]|nr:hypothetical protein [Anaerolineales bacterium]
MTWGNAQLAGFLKNGRFHRLPLLVLLLTLFILLPTQPQPAAAQDQVQAYWRHSASRRISHVITHDVNRDGVDEFVIAAENGRVDLLSSIGALQWSFPAGDIIQAINVLNIDDDPEEEIALVSNRQLTMLSSGGTQLWSIELMPIAPPQPLLAFSSSAAGKEWLAQYNIEVRQIEPFDHDGDGRDELIVLYSNGQLQLFDADGKLIWSDSKSSTALQNTRVMMQIADLNGDNLEEVAFGYFNPTLRFSQLRLINGNQEDIWEQPQPISDVISAITVVPFGDNGSLYLAVGSEGGQIHLIDYTRQRVWWPRTLNKPITALTAGEFRGEPLLLAGTEVGVVVAYRANGSRLWTRRLVPDANRPIVSLTTAQPATDENEPLVAVILGPAEGSNAANDVLLLGPTNRLLTTYERVDANGLTKLLDINKDGRYELLLARFATVELLGLGVGTSEIAPEWSYSLDSEPGAILVVDFDDDGEDELVVGAKDGRLHYLNQQNSVDWLVSPGGNITHLALLETAAGEKQIVVIRNSTTIGLDNQEQQQGWVDVRDVDGEQLWERPLEANITSLLVQDINDRGDPEIIVGTRTGEIFAFSANDTELWSRSLQPEGGLGQPVTRLLLIDSLENDQPVLVAASGNRLYSVQMRGTFAPTRIAVYPAPIHDIYGLKQPGLELATRLLVFTENQASGLTWRG